MPNRPRCHTAVAAVLVATMSLGACATNPDGSTPNLFSDIGTTASSGSDANLTPEQRALRQQEKDYAETRLTGAAVGAVGGALLGAALGAAFGGGRGAATGAAIGALAGGTAGYVGTTYLARDHQQFTASRDSLQADIDAAKADTAKMERNVQVAQNALSAQRTQLNRVNADLRAGRISEQQARAQVATAADDLRSVRALADESDKRVSSLTQSVAAYRQAGLPTGDLNTQLQQQKAHTASLRRVERSMVSALQGTPAAVRPTV